MPVCETMALPSWGFHSFEMPDGQEFIASFYGDEGAEIDVVERHQSLGPIEDKADWLGLTGEVSFPVPGDQEVAGNKPGLLKLQRFSVQAQSANPWTASIRG